MTAYAELSESWLCIGVYSKQNLVGVRRSGLGLAFGLVRARTLPNPNDADPNHNPNPITLTLALALTIYALSLKPVGIFIGAEILHILGCDPFAPRAWSEADEAGIVLVPFNDLLLEVARPHLQPIRWLRTGSREPVRWSSTRPTSKGAAPQTTKPTQ